MRCCGRCNRGGCAAHRRRARARPDSRSERYGGADATGPPVEGAATVQAGLDQVIDDVWLTPWQPAGLEQALSGAAVLWVGVRCALDVLEERERRRGDRPIGTSRGQFDLVHSFRSYDVEIDTTTTAPDACVAAILERLHPD